MINKHFSKRELIELLERLEEYMNRFADTVDTDSGAKPDEAMQLQVEIKQMIQTVLYL